MKYVEYSGILGTGTPKEVSKKELLQRANVAPSVLNGLVDKKIFEIYYHEIGRLNKQEKEVVELKAKKPIVVSMGNYAASGGYYISCAANKIVAERTTLTGSIGVFGVVRNFTGTFDKVGVTTDVVKTNTFADLGDISRPMREDEKALIQRGVEQTYDLFLTRCADGRGMTKAEIDSIGQGRVWTGEQALERGLVDQLGGMDDAIKEAATLAELTDYSVTVADGPKDFFTKFMEKQMDEAKVSIAKSVMGEEQFKLFSTIRRAETESGIIARMPFDMKGL